LNTLHAHRCYHTRTSVYPLMRKIKFRAHTKLEEELEFRLV
jgi:hypothetical protein